MRALLLPLLFLLIGCTNEPADEAPPLESGVVGDVVHYADFSSEFVDARNVDVWLPPAYDSTAAYPVVYMHDGQNLFDPELSYIGVDWGVDEAMTALIDSGAVEPAIIVGIWNTPKRFPEYMPQKVAFTEAHAEEFEQYGGAPISDLYLRFLIEELKPFIDDTYATKPRRDHTFIMGSSMGGLISCYALMEYPEVYGGAGCVSTHWPIGDGIVIDYVAENLPEPGSHKIYFDHGTETLDAQYGPYQEQVDELMRAAGFSDPENWMTRVFEGTDHSERAWRERVHIPLMFFLACDENRSC